MPEAAHMLLTGLMPEVCQVQVLGSALTNSVRACDRWWNGQVLTITNTRLVQAGILATAKAASQGSGSGACAPSACWGALLP